MKNKIDQCGIILLAAGQSSRLGSPKQLLEYEGISLIVKAVETATHTRQYPVVVVLGAHAKMIEPYLDNTSIKVVDNQEWEQGVSSSIRKGIQSMNHYFPTVDGIVFMVCDQPYLDHLIIAQLIDLQNETGLPAAACIYDDNIGTPALFHKSLFNDLINLNGDKGARMLLMQMKDDVALLSFEGGSTDIDTKEDYKKLLADT